MNHIQLAFTTIKMTKETILAILWILKWIRSKREITQIQDDQEWILVDENI